MAYTPTSWTNGTTPINATNLNKMETGISNAVEKNTNALLTNVLSRNLFDKNTFVLGNEKNVNPTIRISSRQVLYLQPGTYTYSTNITSSGQDIRTTEVMVLDSKPGGSSYTYIHDSGWVSSPYTFTITTAGYFCINLRFNDGRTLTIDDFSSFNYQLEEGSSATSYVPYLNLEEAMTENDIYSTSERVVGIFLGKPLYRKQITFTTSSTVSTSNFINIDTTSIDYFNIENCICNNRPYNYYIDSTNNRLALDIINYNNKLSYRVLTSDVANTQCTLVYLYTKTTD